jgi:hypothetical protein
VKVGVLFAAGNLLCSMTASCERIAPPSLVDTLSIGNTSSENHHNLQLEKGKHIAGGLQESALILLPSATKPWESAPLGFTLKVDPEKQNYFWGGDKGEDCGRLLVYIDGKQLGYNGAGDYSTLNQTDEEAEAPGRFFYETLPLPLALTKGKASIEVKVVARGPRWVYGQTFDKFQKPFTKESRGIYGFYTHTDAHFVPPATEKQGQMPNAGPRPSPGEEVIRQSKEVVIKRVKDLLKSEAKPDNAKSFESRLSTLGEAYNLPWTPAYHNSKAIDQIVAMGDLKTADFITDPNSVSGSWLGAGPLGLAIMKTWPEIGNRMEEKITLGNEEVPRREAWSRLLKASIDYWRTHRRSYTNQSMIVDEGIYTANCGLALINPSVALPQSQALRYVYEAVGLEPWLGSDSGGEKTGEKDVPMANCHAPYGNNYFLFTKKGLSRELGFVAGYGETILRFAHDMALLTGDEKVRQQAKKIANARLNFRYPALDADGFRCMKLTSEIDERGEHFPISGPAYADNYASGENWGMDLPALLPEDPKTVGAAQQSLEDNQYFHFVAERIKGADTLGLMRNADDYAKVKPLPPSPFRLPMSEGQPDFVFSDEENAVLAIKHGDTRLFVNLYFRAENGVNSVARILEITPTITRIATVKTQVEVDESGKSFTRPDFLQCIRRGSERLNPPGEDSHQAWAGEVMPIAKRPADASQPSYGAWGPFLGKASFYWVRYGNYLIALNTTEDRTFSLPAAASLDLPQAKELVSGKDLDLKRGVPVPPLTTKVLFLGKRL